MGHFLVQAIAAGAALLLLAAPLMDLPPQAQRTLAAWLIGFLAAHAILTQLKELALAPKGREEEFLRAVHLITHGPFAQRHLWLGKVVGILIPVLLIDLGGPGWMFGLAGALALVGLWSEEDILVRAGQALPIS